MNKQRIIDEIFDTWDELFDYDRSGIEMGHTGLSRIQFEFKSEGPNFEIFIKLIEKYLEENSITYDWIDPYSILEIQFSLQN